MNPTVPITLALAVCGTIIALIGRPVIGFAVYLAISYLYPDYLRVSLGSLDISATRIIVTILLVRCMAEQNLMQRFRWLTLDSWVAASMAIYAITLAFTTDLEVWFENRSGFIMDTFFAYLAARIILVDRESFVVVAKAMAFIAVPLAINGLIETFTGRSIYAGLGQYCTWAPDKGMLYQERFGLNRAMGPHGETIMFGLSVAVLTPIIYCLRHEKMPWDRFAYFFTLVSMAAVASTVSSGPYLALIVVLGCLVLEHKKSLVKPILIAMIAGCFLVELVANRHFYYILADFTMDADSGWYRARLVDVAIWKLPEYWLTGYGLIDPGWGPDINALRRTDLVNDFVLCAAYFGLFGLIAYVAVLASAIRSAYLAHKNSTSPWVKSYAWALVTTLVSLIAAFWSVSLFGQMVAMLYVLLGMHGALYSMTLQTSAAPVRQRVQQQFHPHPSAPMPRIQPAIRRTLPSEGAR